MTLQETLKSNKYLDYKTAVKLTSWINSVILSDSDAQIEERVIKTLRLREKTFNPKKGNLLSYLKTSINFDVLKLKTAPKLDYHSFLFAQEETSPVVDMSNFTDREIVAMYNVYRNMATQEDVDIVKGLRC